MVALPPRAIACHNAEVAVLAKVILGAGAIVLALGCGPDKPPATNPEISHVDAPAPPPADASPVEPAPLAVLPLDAAPIVLQPGAPEARCEIQTLEVGSAPLGYRARGQVCEDLRQGPWEFSYLINGKRLRKGSYKDGVETGKWTFWYKTGRKRSEGRFKAGQRTGPWIRNHKNGQRSLAGSYEGGLRNGQWRRWHESGQLYEDRIYVAGRREGVHHKWSSEGLLQYTRLCKDDVCKVQCRAKREEVCPPLSPPLSPAVPGAPAP
jgi:hypothetical protein